MIIVVRVKRMINIFMGICILNKLLIDRPGCQIESHAYNIITPLVETGHCVENTRAHAVLGQGGYNVSVMRRVVETTCEGLILHHVTHSNNHLITEGGTCGGAGEIEVEETRYRVAEPRQHRSQHPAVSVPGPFMRVGNCYLHNVYELSRKGWGEIYIGYFLIRRLR